MSLVYQSVRVALAVSLVGAVLSMAGPIPRGAGVSRSDDDTPVVVVWQQGGWIGESGLVLAAWSDGRVVVAANPDAPGTDMRLGLLPADVAIAAFEAINTSELAQTPSRSYFVPDAPSFTIHLVVKDRTTIYRWDERVHPGYGANIEADEDYIAFAGGWTRLRIRLLKLYEFDREKAEEVGPKHPLVALAIQAVRSRADRREVRPGAERR